jgi:hypothetical protein
MTAGTSDHRSMNTTEIESFKNLTFKGSTVLSLLAFALTSIGASVWYLYANGAFSPDIELSKRYATTSYKYEKLTEDHRIAVAKIAKLETAAQKLREKNLSYQSGIDFERIKSDERIRLKEIELENARILKSEELKAQARIAESESAKSIADAELSAKTIESKALERKSENEKETNAIAVCVQLKGEYSDPDEILKSCMAAYREEKAKRIEKKGVRLN